MKLDQALAYLKSSGFKITQKGTKTFLVQKGNDHPWQAGEEKLIRVAEKYKNIQE